MKAKKFPPDFAARVIRGDIIMHFQRWEKGKQPDVVSHERYLIQPYVKDEKKPRTALGSILIKQCVLVDIDDITQDDAQAAGYTDKLHLRQTWEKRLNDGKELPKYTCLWRIDWRVIERADGKPVPRTAAEKAEDERRAAEIEEAEAA